jgi:hypothetical protein
MAVFIGGIGATRSNGNLFERFDKVAKKTGFNLRGADLVPFLKWINVHGVALFGKNISRKKWFTLLDEYPILIDVISSAKIDVDPLMDENEDRIERFYAKAKKS